jgi:hypothetical protein
VVGAKVSRAKVGGAKAGREKSWWEKKFDREQERATVTRRKAIST